MRAKNITQPTNRAFTQKLAFFDYALKTKPLHYWPMGELAGSTAHDRGSGGVNGTIGVDVTRGVFSKVGTGMEFDGGGHHINCGDAASSTFTSLSIACLFKASSFSPGRWRTHLHRNNGTSVGSSVFFIGHETGTNKILGTIGAGFGAPGTYQAGKTEIVAQIGTWYYVVSVWTGSVVRVYVNGTQEKTYNYNGPLTNKGATTRIGTSGAYHFNGIIDEAGIWDRDLSVDEVEKLTKLSGV